MPLKELRESQWVECACVELGQCFLDRGILIHGVLSPSARSRRGSGDRLALEPVLTTPFDRRCTKLLSARDDGSPQLIDASLVRSRDLNQARGFVRINTQG